MFLLVSDVFGVVSVWAFNTYSIFLFIFRISRQIPRNRKHYHVEQYINRVGSHSYSNLISSSPRGRLAYPKSSHRSFIKSTVTRNEIILNYKKKRKKASDIHI